MPRSVITPLVVTLGTTRDRYLADFRSGVGRIADDVEEVMTVVRKTIASEEGNRVLLPVVVIYADKR